MFTFGNVSRDTSLIIGQSLPIMSVTGSINQNVFNLTVFILNVGLSKLLICTGIVYVKFNLVLSLLLLW